MPELPRLVSLSPSETDPIPAEVYNDLFILGLKIITMDDLSQSVSVRLQNYNYDTQKLSPNPEDSNSLFIPNLMQEAARVPLLAQTAGMLIYTTGLLYQEKELKRLIQKAIENGEPTTDIEAQLADVQAAMGIE